MYRTVPGWNMCGSCEMLMPLSMTASTLCSLKSTLEFKKIRGLFAGGQFNGSSGYEEAAVQGFMAGVNASMEGPGREQVVLDRSRLYRCSD